MTLSFDPKELCPPVCVCIAAAPSQPCPPCPPCPPVVACGSLSGSGSPVGANTPTFIGQLYHDTVAGAYWRSTGLTSADWVAIGGGSGNGLVWGPNATTLDSMSINSGTTFGPLETDFTFPSLTAITGQLLIFGPVVQSISLPALVTGGDFIDTDGSSALVSISSPLLQTVGVSGIDLDTCPLLTTIDFSSLVTSGSINVFDCVSLPVLNLPSLVTVTPVMSGSGCSALVTVIVPNYIPTDGSFINFNGCALNATSVELILRRCVLAGVTTCIINLAGGTNAGTASLNAQGQADVITLGAQLTINP